jgi:uncharacterized membrane protein YraQ (UPF0718 family)/copper chaperone CopZ
MIIDLLNEIVVMFLEMSPYMLLGLAFVGILHLWITKEMVSKYVGKKDIWSIFKASLFGVPLPLCSCGVIPTSVFLTKNGASKGSTVSFLISTPQTGIDSIIATYGMMGWLFAIYRPIAAFAMGIIGGTITHKFVKDEPQESSKPAPKMIEIDQYKPKENVDSCGDGCSDEENEKPKGAWNKLKSMWNYAFVEFLDDISKQFIVGVIIAGFIAYFLPADILSEMNLTSGIIAMLAIILIGIPMYVCATASIPIAVALMMKGFSPGVAFVFLAVGPATNAASLSILAKTLGRKVTAMYVAIISLTAIVMGYLLDYLFYYIDADPVKMMAHQHGSTILTEDVKIIIGVLFLLMLAGSMYRKYFRKYFNKQNKENDMEIQIEGMSCNHCVANVEKAIAKVSGVDNYNVILSDGKAVLEGNFDVEKVKNEIEEVGYKVTGVSKN